MRSIKKDGCSRWIARMGLWLIVVLVASAILLLEISGCGGSKATTTTTTVAAAATETTVIDTSTTEQVTTTTDLATTTTVQAVPGAVLYDMKDWSVANNGWAATGQWKTVGKMLVSDGSERSNAVAPVELATQDYAVEAEIQILVVSDVALVARMVNGTGYSGGYRSGYDSGTLYISYGGDDISSADFKMDQAWHKYRLEVRGNSLRLLVDGAEVVRAMDNRMLDAGTVGIYSGSSQMNVRAFRVIAL